MIATLPHLMPEAWMALAGIAGLAVFAFLGLSGFIQECFDNARAERTEAERVRKLKQRNIRHLIEACVDSDHVHEMLDEALRDSIEDYRA